MKGEGEVPRTTRLRHRDGLLAREVLRRIAIGYYLATQTASIRSYLDEVVGSSQNLLVVLHYNHRIAYVTKFA